jgi:anti-anti-sigma regulatory factor
MKFAVEPKDKLVIISTNVEKLDALQAPELKSEIVLQNKAGVRNIVLGLSAILVANRLCRDANGSCVITGLQDSVKKLITLSQLESVLKITPTVNEAVDLVYMEEVEREL